MFITVLQYVLVLLIVMLTYIYHRFLVYDPYDQYLPFAIESFKLPSACACYNGAYAEPPH